MESYIVNSIIREDANESVSSWDALSRKLGQVDKKNLFSEIINKSSDSKSHISLNMEAKSSDNAIITPPRNHISRSLHKIEYK